MLIAVLISKIRQMKNYYLPALVFIAMTACNSANREPRSSYENAANTIRKETKRTSGDHYKPGDVLSSSAARIGFSDSLYQFIRTAQLKFKTPNVVRSSFAIEDVVDQHGGYVEHSKIESKIREENQVRCSKDSAWRVVKFVTYNQLNARIPAENLDQALKALRPFVSYLDYRIVDASNISFDKYANELKRRRIAAYSDQQQKFAPKEQAQTADQLLQRQIESDESLVENMRTEDKVKFSTVEIYLYQNEEVSMEKIPVFYDLKPYDSGFGMQFTDSLALGWEIVEMIVLLIVKMWSVLLILALVLILIRQRRKRASN